MEGVGTPVRRSCRLQTEPTSIPNPVTPTTVAEEDEQGLAMERQELPDLGPGVELVMLPEMDVYFNEQYLSSQKPRTHYCASDEDSEHSDHDFTKGGGLESIL